MAHILIDAGMPFGDHIEARDFNRRLEHDQLLTVLAQETRWNDRNKVVRLPNL